MNWEALGSLAELIGVITVIATLFYLSYQVKENTRALSAQSRHSLSEFVLHVSMFRAEHADRYARLATDAERSPGDLEFLYWSHMQLTLHAESYFRHHELGLMPDHHWRGYEKFLTRYVQDPDFQGFWDDVGFGFSEHFRDFIDDLLTTQAGAPVAPKQ